MNFLVDGAELTGSPLTTTIPTTNAIAPYMSMVKTLGVTSRDLQVDYMEMFMDVTR